MSDDKVTQITELQPDPRNARKHNTRNIEMIGESLHEVGAARSIVIDENNVILAGNGVIEAAPQAGITRVRVIEADGSEIIAVRRTGLSPAQKQRLALYDNRAAELAEWDATVLADLAQDADVALDQMFDAAELDELLGDLLPVEPPPDAGAQIDRAAELQEKWQAERGQVWGIGAFTRCPKCGKVHNL